MTSAAIVLVGDELLTGRRPDTNGLWLARRFQDLGVSLQGVHMVPDVPEAIAEVVVGVAAHVELVVVSGGLGPTDDDRTREGLAQAAGTALVDDEGAWKAVVACLAARGRTPPEGERRQGQVPAGARWLTNPVGVAPGIDVQVGGARVVALPGVPREWQSMCEAHVLPGLGAAQRAVVGSVWVAGVPEGEIDAALRDLPALAAVAIASYPHDGEVELRFRAEGETAAKRVESAVAATRATLGAATFDPPPGGRIQHVVVQALSDRGLTVATAESITGGLIARLLTSVPGASAVFPAGWITYATEQKTARLGVPAALIERYGVVSEAVVCAMAEGARVRAGVDLALATTGAAGPDPLVQAGHAPVPPGQVHVALAREGSEPRCLTLLLPFGRVLTQHHAAIRALDLLRRTLAE